MEPEEEGLMADGDTHWRTSRDCISSGSCVTGNDDRDTNLCWWEGEFDFVCLFVSLSSSIREFTKPGRQRQPERHLKFRKANLISVCYL